jgi:hypothetical protein
MMKGLDSLRFTIFKDGESVAVKVGNNVLFVVHDGGVEHNLLHIAMENKAAGLDAWFLPLSLSLGRGLSGRWGLRLGWRGCRLGAAGRSLRRILGRHSQAQQA